VEVVSEVIEAKEVKKLRKGSDAYTPGSKVSAPKKEVEISAP